jgi:hypothetical protein
VGSVRVTEGFGKGSESEGFGKGSARVPLGSIVFAVATISASPVARISAANTDRNRSEATNLADRHADFRMFGTFITLLFRMWVRTSVS